MTKHRKNQAQSRLKLKVMKMIELTLDSDNKPVNLAIASIMYAVALFITLGGITMFATSFITPFVELFLN